MLKDLRGSLEPLGRLDLLDKVGDEAMAYFAAAPAGGLSDEELSRQAQALPHPVDRARAGSATGGLEEARGDLGVGGVVVSLQEGYEHRLVFPSDGAAPTAAVGLGREAAGAPPAAEELL